MWDDYIEPQKLLPYASIQQLWDKINHCHLVVTISHPTVSGNIKSSDIGKPTRQWKKQSQYIPILHSPRRPMPPPLHSCGPDNKCHIQSNMCYISNQRSANDGPVERLSSVSDTRQPSQSLPVSARQVLLPVSARQHCERLRVTWFSRPRVRSCRPRAFNRNGAHAGPTYIGRQPTSGAVQLNTRTGEASG